MRFPLFVPLLASLASASSLVARALPKANEYPQPACLDNNGGNSPSWHHSKLCGCVSMDPTTVSVFLTASPGQKIYAFDNQACNPGFHREHFITETGGGCHSIDDNGSDMIMQGVFFYVPLVCDLVEIMGDLAEGLQDVLKDIIEEA